MTNQPDTKTHPATGAWRSVRDSMKHYGHEWNDHVGNRLVLTDERYADCDEWCLGLYSPYDDNDPLMDEDVNSTPAYYVYGTQAEIETALAAFGLEFPTNSFRIIHFPN